MGGPYREILSDIIEELQSDYIELFIKTGNNLYIINPNVNNRYYHDINSTPVTTYDNATFKDNTL